MQKLYLIILLLLLIAPQFAMAQSAYDKNGWVPDAGSKKDGIVFYINLSTFSISGPKSFTYWQKMILTSPAKKPDLLFDEITLLTEFDCNQNRSRALKIIFKLNGSITKELNKPSSWGYNDPDSAQNTFNNDICKKGFPEKVKEE